jgi:hypothetical protein
VNLKAHTTSHAISHHQRKHPNARQQRRAWEFEFKRVLSPACGARFKVWRFLVTFLFCSERAEMPSPTSGRIAASFDEIYAKGPVEQVDRLKEFRRAHPYQHLTCGGTRWEYITCGRGEQTLLLLPGAQSVGESTFPLVTAFENDYRIIAPSYSSVYAVKTGVTSMHAPRGLRGLRRRYGDV